MSNIKGLIYRVANYYKPGCVEEGQGRNFSCCFQKDQTPSAKIYPDTEIMICWSCHFYGDAIQAVKHAEGFESWSETKKFIKETFGVSLESAKKHEKSDIKLIHNLAVDLVIQSKHPKFNTYYFVIDKAYYEKDEKKLMKIVKSLTEYNYGKN